MKRFLVLFSVLLFSTLSVLSFGGSYASAASEYDDIVKTPAPNGVIFCYENQNGDRTGSIDLTTKFSSLTNPEVTSIDGKEILWIGGSVSREELWSQMNDKLVDFKGYGVRMSISDLNNSEYSLYGNYQLFIQETGSVSPLIFNSSGLISTTTTLALDVQCVNDELRLTSSRSSSEIIQASWMASPLLFWAGDINYPPNYEGVMVPDTPNMPVDPKILKPDYQWRVEKNGDLKLNYLKNLPYFLTGSTNVELIRMTENWGQIDESISNDRFAPAGWLNFDSEYFPLPNETDPRKIKIPGGGYFMLAISHSQQLESPPWPQDEEYFIDTRYIQIFWDGQTAIDGSTVGCEGVCNDFLDKEKPVNKWLKGLTTSTHGLSAVITAPLAFIGNLPNAAASCNKLVLPLPMMNKSLEIPCMTPVYQQNFGNIFTIFQTVVTGIMSYVIAIKIFHRIKEISNPKNDQIEVVDL